MFDLTVIELAADIALGVVFLGLGVFVWAALKLRAIHVDLARELRSMDAELARPFVDQLEKKVTEVTYGD